MSTVRVAVLGEVDSERHKHKTVAKRQLGAFTTIMKKR